MTEVHHHTHLHHTPTPHTSTPHTYTTHIYTTHIYTTHTTPHIYTTHTTPHTLHHAHTTPHPSTPHTPTPHTSTPHTHYTTPIYTTHTYTTHIYTTHTHTLVCMHTYIHIRSVHGHRIHTMCVGWILNGVDVIELLNHLCAESGKSLAGALWYEEVGVEEEGGEVLLVTIGCRTQVYIECYLQLYNTSCAHINLNPSMWPHPLSVLAQLRPYGPSYKTFNEQQGNMPGRYLVPLVTRPLPTMRHSMVRYWSRSLGGRKASLTALVHRLVRHVSEEKGEGWGVRMGCGTITSSHKLLFGVDLTLLCVIRYFVLVRRPSSLTQTSACSQGTHTHMQKLLAVFIGNM